MLRQPCILPHRSTFAKAHVSTLDIHQHQTPSSIAARENPAVRSQNGNSHGNRNEATTVPNRSGWPLWKHNLLRTRMLRPRKPIPNQTRGVALCDTLASRTVAKCNFEDANRLLVLPASQVRHAGRLRSCAAAVWRVIVLCVALGRQPPSPDTGAYCPARAK